MAATGFTPISLYYSTTASAVPLAANLANGELALNTADMKLYTKNSSGVVTLLASSSGATGTVSSVAVSGGTTGLTTSGGPITTSGTITLAGTLATTNGGTGLTSFTANGVVYASGTGTLATGSALTFNGTNLENAQNTASPTGLILGNSSASTSAGTRVSFQFNGGTTGYVGNQFDGTDFNNQYNANRFHIWLNGGSETMRLTSTSLYTASGINVGIGTSSPSQKLDVSGGNARISSGASTADLLMVDTGTTSGNVRLRSQSNSMLFITGGGVSGTLDSAGNLGLGVTPSAWWSGMKALDVGAASALVGSTAQTDIFTNAYFNGSSTLYKTTGIASLFRASSSGGYQWYTAPSGTAGTAISFTQAMTLDASNNLLVGTTSNPSSSRVMIGNGTPSAASTTQHIGWGDGTKTTLMQQTGSSYSYAGVGANAMWWYLNSNWSALTIGSDGAVPITFVSNGAERTRISTTGGFSVGTTADPGAGGIYATGAITAYYSDERLKDVKGRIQNALAKVRRLSGVYYTNNETAKALGYTSDEMQVGVLANQMKGELPEIVKPAPFDLDENGNSKSGQNYMTVQYERGLPLIIEAIKELADTVDALAAR